MKPPVVSSPCSRSWPSLLRYLVLSLCSVPCSSQICVIRPLHFCASSLSFLPLFLQLFTCVSISGPALESTSKCLFPKPTGSIVVFYMYLPNRATLLPKQSFYLLTHAFWCEPFPCPGGYLQNLLGFCHDLSLGKGVGFLEVILSHEQKVGMRLCWSSAADTSGAGYSSQATGCVSDLDEIDSCREYLDWARSRPGRLGNEERWAAFAAGWESTFFTISLPWLMAREGLCHRHQSPWVNSGHICKTTCCTL